MEELPTSIDKITDVIMHACILNYNNYDEKIHNKYS